MTAELRIGTLRLHGRPDRTRQVDARATLASLDLRPVGRVAGAVVDSWARASAIRRSARTPRRALRRTAQRPTLGGSIRGPKPSSFSDAGGGAALPLRRRPRRRAGRRGGGPAGCPSAARRRRHPAPRSRSLAGGRVPCSRSPPSRPPPRHLLAEALAALGPRATAAVLDAILEEHLPELAGPLSPGAPPTVPTPRAQQDKANPPPAWLPLPITEVLLTTATTLAEHPAMARTPEFSRWLLEARVQPVEAPATLSSDVAEPVVDPVAEEPPVSHLQVVGESGASLPPLPKEDPAPDVPLAKNAVAPLRSRQRRTAPPAPRPLRSPAWQHRYLGRQRTGDEDRPRDPAVRREPGQLVRPEPDQRDHHRMGRRRGGRPLAAARRADRAASYAPRRSAAHPLRGARHPPRRRYATLSGWVPRSGRYAGSSPPTTSRSAHSPNPARSSSRAPTSTSSSASTRSISAPAPAVSTRTPAGCPSWAESCCSTSRAPPDDVRRTGASTGPGEDAAPARTRVERDGRPDLARRLPGRARGVPAPA